MESGKSKKDTTEEGKDYEGKIKKLEKRIEELEKKEEGEEISTVESVVSQFIPGLGGIVKALESSSPEFRKRIAETDAEIKHRIETGWSSEPRVDYGISIKPLVPERKAAPIKEEEKVEEPEREPIIDVFEEKDYISVIAELPGIEEKDIGTKLTGNTLEISAGKHSRTIKLPSIPKSIIERTYRHGILQLKIERG
ncbi:MAG: Hsp20/alpha crystallin family protein [Candidatus Methanoperedens sp.]|nr:Hsp20/alpha crystallin family protein [Candidatus Methanoperedens sp.]